MAEEVKGGGKEEDQDLPLSNVFPVKLHHGVYVLCNAEMEDFPTFKCRQDDVWVCSFPRSGTTLTQHMTYLIMTLDFEKATTVQLDDRFPLADCYEPSFPYYRGLKYLDSLPECEPRMIKCHLPYFLLPDQLQQGTGRVIYITRNPKASLVSFYKMLCYMSRPPAPTLKEFVRMFLDSKDVFGTPWEKHIRPYWERRNDKHVMFLQFEKLVKDRRGTIKKIADFLSKDLSEEQIDKIYESTSLESMKKNDAVNFMYFEDQFKADKEYGGLINTGSIYGWRKEFPEELVGDMDELIKKATKDTDVEFD